LTLGCFGRATKACGSQLNRMSVGRREDTMVKRHQGSLGFLVPVAISVCSVTAVLACGAHRAPDADSEHEQAIRQLERRLAHGMPRVEIENVLQEMNLRFHYVPRDMLEDMRRGTDESASLGGALYVTLPEDVGFFYKTKGEAIVDLDDAGSLAGFQVQQMNVPR